MADAFPKEILPDLEGKIGELILMRFWSKVDIAAPEDCWEWQASRHTSGYGRFKIASHRTVMANRFSLIAHHRSEPAGMLALHTCDNRPCCNPHHLYFGTHQQNMRDKVDRGRCYSGDQSGANNGHSKLTEKQIAQIVGLFREGQNNTQIAAKMPIGHSLVSRIRVGRSWRTQTAALGWVPEASKLPHARLSPQHKKEEADAE